LIVGHTFKDQLLGTLGEVVAFAAAALRTMAIAARVIHFGDFAAIIALKGLNHPELAFGTATAWPARFALAGKRLVPCTA
jgi:hypothetical protein